MAMRRMVPRTTQPAGGGKKSTLDRLEAATRSAPVVRMVDRMIRTAINEGASDIHVEETGADLRVRYRIDGVLGKASEFPASVRNAVLSRLKVMAEMDVSVRRRAQDGSFELRHRGRRLSLRVSTLPVNRGEKAVVRILDTDGAPSGLNELGMGEHDMVSVRDLLDRGDGALLVSGATGSGKSTTVFAALSELDREGRNVVTLEDPVEYRLPGTNQVQVDKRAGLGFAEALRAILRQDPDIVMVGEIRDPETAEIAMSAATTGHLVLSTIHTTDAPGAVLRLLDMGVPPYLVAGGLSGVVAQRLVRRLCPVCRGPGCDACRGEGHRGRTGIFQVLTVGDAMREAISRGEPSAELRRIAVKSGMGTLSSDARRVLAAGLSSPHELGLLLRASADTERCGGCDEPLPTGATACPMCGRPQARTCPCGRKVEPHWRYCAWCSRLLA